LEELAKLQVEGEADGEWCRGGGMGEVEGKEEVGSLSTAGGGGGGGRRRAGLGLELRGGFGSQLPGIVSVMEFAAEDGRGGTTGGTGECKLDEYWCD
jgi:hypothetical protein